MESAKIDVDERVKNETRDFFYEALLLLERSQNIIMDEEEEPAEKHEQKSAEHIILYAFFALSLIRDAERDVAAVAAYQMPKVVRVYFTKNSLNESDIAMANNLVDLICSTARDKTVTADNFHERYFQYLTETCASKFKKRFDGMKASILKPKRDGDLMPSTAADLESRLASLENTGIRPGNRADRAAVSFSKNGNVCEGVKLALSAIRAQILKNQNLRSYVKLSLRAWVVASNSVTASILGEYSTLNPLVLALQKYGEYYRGASRLFNIITDPDPKTRSCYSSVELIPVKPPPPLRVKLEPDWFYVLQVLYYRAKKEMMPIQKGHFMARYSAAISAYEKGDREKQKFLPHCETTLIRHLTAEFGPTELGISKACCPLCYAYIQGINAHRKHRGQSQWKVGASYSNVYLWQCESETEVSLAAGEASVKEFVFDRIIRRIDMCRGRGSESPFHPFSPGSGSYADTPNSFFEPFS